MGFPSLIVDNFFDYPDKVIDFANTLEYNKSVDGRWPGKRSNFSSRYCLFFTSILYVDGLNHPLVGSYKEVPVPTSGSLVR